MSELSTQFSYAKKLTLELRQGTDQLARLEGTQAGQVLGKELKNKFDALKKASDDIESRWRVLVMREPGKKGEIWKHKVAQLVKETSQIHEELHRYLAKERRRRVEEQGRAELLAGVDRDTARLYQPGYDPESGEMESARNAHRMVDDLLASGSSILSGLGEQRDRLKAAQRKVFDVLNTTGLSDSLLRVIQRRQSTDRLLVYGGMIVTLVFVWLLWWWVKH